MGAARRLARRPWNILDTWQLIALAAALGWASGIRLYAVLFVVGAVGFAGWFELPAASARALASAGPERFRLHGRRGVLRRQDSQASTPSGTWCTPWSASPPAPRSPRACSATRLRRGRWPPAIVGGTLAAGSHFTKAGARMVINTSPEPFSNWAASFGEDLLVGALLYLALAHPIASLIVLALLILAVSIWLLPKLWRSFARIVERIAHARLGRTARGHDQGAAMFDKILIANRGEIACRVARTARRMGIRTVAVYSDADAGACTSRPATKRIVSGRRPPRESYLRGDRIIDIAAALRGTRRSIPATGFFPRTRISPPPSPPRVWSSSVRRPPRFGRWARNPNPSASSAKRRRPPGAGLSRDGTRTTRCSLARPSASAIRCSSRRRPAAAAKACASSNGATSSLPRSRPARREAKSGFGDDAMLLEKYLTEPRHIEIQVFADTHGECVHLFERDCSVQRRHQKVLEEAPAPGMTRERRARDGRGGGRAPRRRSATSVPARSSSSSTATARSTSWR